MKRGRFILLMLLAVLLISCGGGGGGDTSGSGTNPLPDTTPPVITLNGANPVTVLVGATYVDAGATALDDVDGDISNLITITGTVNINTAGSYPLVHNVSDKAGNPAASVTRTVNVVSTPPPPDTTPPIITLNGASAVNIFVGTAYVDAGATALDDRDGNITNLIMVAGLPINTNVAGSHLVTYAVPDTAGNSSSVTRTVNVVSVPPPPDTTPPVITMLGANTVTISVGATYADAGATALDDRDGNITNKIAVTGLPVNTSVVGSNYVTYNVPDTAGNQAVPVVRTVNVVAAPTGPPEVPYYKLSPSRVLTPGSTEVSTITYKFPVDVDRVEFLLAPPSCSPGSCASGERIQFARVGTYEWSASIGNAKLLQYYVSGEWQAFAGYVDLYVNSARVGRYNMFFYVLPAGTPLVSITNVSPRVQTSSHVINIQEENLFLGGTTNTYEFVWPGVRATAESITTPPDVWILVGQVSANANRTGGGGGVITFPRAPSVRSPVADDYRTFSLGAPGVLNHEWGHVAGLVWSNQTYLADPIGGGHFALGNAAGDAMGYSDTNRQGISFPYHIEPGDTQGTTKICSRASLGKFSPLELYMLGVPLSANPVSDIRQFADQAQARALISTMGSVPTCGSGYAVLNTPSIMVSVSDILAADGPPPAVKRNWRAKQVVLSEGRKLNLVEISFFTAKIKREEGTQPFPDQDGFLRNPDALPLYLATDGYFSWITKIN